MPCRLVPPFAVFCLLLFVGCEDRRFRVPDRDRLPDPKTITRYRAEPPLSPPLARSLSPTPLQPLLLQPAFGHAETPRTLAIDPGGIWAISGGDDRLVIRWRLPDGQRLRTWADFPAPIRSLSIAPDGRRWAALSGERDLSLWSASGQGLQRLHLPSPASSLRFAPIHPVLYVALSRSVLVLDALSLERKEEIALCPAGERLMALDIEPIRQTFLAAGCSHGSLILHPLLSPTSLQRLSLPVQGGAVTAVAFDPLGLSLATASQDTSIQLWQVADDRLSAASRPTTFRLKKIRHAYGHSRPIRTLRWKADGRLLASGSLDQSVGLWSVAPTSLRLLRRIPHQGAIEALEWMPDQPNLLTLDHRRSFRRLDEKGQSLWERKPLPRRSAALSFSPDGKYLLGEGEQGVAVVWDLATGRSLYALGKHPTPLLSGHFALDGNHILTTDDHNLLFWDFALRRKIDVAKPPKDDVVTAATLGRDWTQVFFGTAQNGVFLWTAAGQRLQYAHREPKHVTAIAFDRPRQIGIVGDIEGRLYLYDLRKYELRQRFKLASQPVSHLSFSPDGQGLVALVGSEAIVLGLPELRPLQRTSASALLRAAAWSSDGKTLALGGDGPAILAWSSPSPPQPLWSGCGSSVRALAFSPNAPLLAASCRDGGLRLWSNTSSHPLLAAWGFDEGHWLAFSPFPSPALLASSKTAPFFHLSNEDSAVSPSLLPLLDPEALRLRLSSRLSTNVSPPSPRVRLPTP